LLVLFNFEESVAECCCCAAEYTACLGEGVGTAGDLKGCEAWEVPC